MYYLIAWVMNIPYRYQQWRGSMISKREHIEYADSVVKQRCLELLDRMVKEEEIDAADVERYLRKFEYILPSPMKESEYIDLVAKLQQQEGERLAKKRVQKTSRKSA